MNILVAAATLLELDPIKSRLVKHNLSDKIIVSFLETGIGTASTTYALTKQLSQARYDLVMHVGIAGCFGSKLQIGDVCIVEQEFFADLGVQLSDKLSTLFEEKILSSNAVPFTGGVLKCPYINSYNIDSLLKPVNAITSDTISGSSKRINQLIDKYNPDIESMEGAAVFYVCLRENIPFLEIRSISNMAGVRDKTRWNIRLALEQLAEKVAIFLEF